jgi:adenosylmethionine-8-amino-7-oxononanoate aminotransferase
MLAIVLEPVGVPSSRIGLITVDKVFYRNPLHDYPMVVRGEGVYMYDADGKQYLDGSGGAAISCLGHGHRVVIDAIKTQAEKLAFAHTMFFTNQPQEDLASKLVEQFGQDDARVYFLSGGSEANETAIKLARQYWLSQGKAQKHLVISRRQSYHGNTLGALSASGNPVRRKVYGPLLHDWPKIDPCYEYRHRRTDESEHEYGERVAGTLEKAILSAGADNVSAFIAETIVGATLGAVAAVAGYFKTIRDICDRHQVLLIMDEVMAGCGRTGTYFAFEQEGFTPDIVTLAKGLAGGYQPIGAAISQGFIHQGIVDAYGSFAHGHSYVGHATVAAAGLAVMRVMHDDNLLDSVNQTGDLLKNRLADVFSDHPHVGDIRGRGLLIAIELVEDRDSKTGIRKALDVPAAIRNAAMENGLICYPGGGTADGVNGAHILLAPPFIYQPKHVDELVSKLEKTLSQVRFINN